MKILVIFTGGTIGSSVSDGYISPDEKCPNVLLEKYRERYDCSDIEFSAISPYTCLSENISAANINRLIELVGRELEGEWDGIIITHGTDSLKYTSAALGLAYSGCRLPVAIVSSNYPLGDGRANGHANFAAAVALVRSGEGGVFVPYRNNDGIVRCHHAALIFRHGEFADNVESYGDVAAIYKDGQISWTKSRWISLIGCGAYTLSDYAEVLSVVCHPCDSFEYDLDKYKAVLFLTYHSGTLNTESPRFEEFCEKAREKGVPLFAVGMNIGVAYKSSERFEKLGIIPLYGCPFPLAFIRLWKCVSEDGDFRDVRAINS